MHKITQSLLLSLLFIGSIFSMNEERELTEKEKTILPIKFIIEKAKNDLDILGAACDKELYKIKAKDLLELVNDCEDYINNDQASCFENRQIPYNSFLTIKEEGHLKKKHTNLLDAEVFQKLNDISGKTIVDVGMSYYSNQTRREKFMAECLCQMKKSINTINLLSVNHLEDKESGILFKQNLSFLFNLEDRGWEGFSFKECYFLLKINYCLFNYKHLKNFHEKTGSYYTWSYDAAENISQVLGGESIESYLERAVECLLNKHTKNAETQYLESDFKEVSLENGWSQYSESDIDSYTEEKSENNFNKFTSIELDKSRLKNPVSYLEYGKRKYRESEPIKTEIKRETLKDVKKVTAFGIASKIEEPVRVVYQRTSKLDTNKSTKQETPYYKK